MKDTKYVGSNGLAFSEETDMAMLSAYAKEGWLLYKFGILGYKLKKGESQDIQYAVDYADKVDEDYFDYFKEAGWTYVCSVQNKINIFSAPIGKKPIYTDRMTNIEKYESQYKQFKKLALPSLALFLLFFFISMLGKYYLVPTIVQTVSTILMVMFVFIAISSGMPCVSYYFKIKELKQKLIYTNETNSIEKHQKHYEKLGRIGFAFLILFILFLVATVLASYSLIPAHIGGITKVLCIIFALAFIFPGISFVSYYFKLKRFKKN